jgi:hypothetical protein
MFLRVHVAFPRTTAKPTDARGFRMAPIRHNDEIALFVVAPLFADSG